jgi:hypothetical protein
MRFTISTVAVQAGAARRSAAKVCILASLLVGACAIPIQTGDPYGAKPAAVPVSEYRAPCPKDRDGNYVCPESVHEVPVVGLDQGSPQGYTTEGVYTRGALPSVPGR